MQTAVFKLLVEYYGAQEKGSNYLSLAGFPGGSVIKNTPANVFRDNHSQQKGSWGQSELDGWGLEHRKGF